MKVHISLSDEMADKLLEQGLVDLPEDFADSIRGNSVKRSEIIKLVIQRELAKLFSRSLGKPEPDAVPDDVPTYIHGDEDVEGDEA
jgi:hypothetical protein